MADSADVCIANIGPRGRRMRRSIGLAGIGIGLLASIGLLFKDTPRWLRLVTFVPFAGGAVSFFQAYEQTCVRFAAEGKRDLELGAGPELITDAQVQQQIQRQVRKVFAKGLLTATLLTVAVLLLPRRTR